MMLMMCLSVEQNQRANQLTRVPSVYELCCCLLIRLFFLLWIIIIIIIIIITVSVRHAPHAVHSVPGNSVQIISPGNPFLHLA